MSDHSRKLLWIAVAISGFALIVLLAVFIIFPPNQSSESRPFDLTGRSPAKEISPNDFSAFPSIVVQSSEEEAQVSDTSKNGKTEPQKPESTVIIVPAPSSNQKTIAAPLQPSGSQSENATAAPKTSQTSQSAQTATQSSTKTSPATTPSASSTQKTTTQPAPSSTLKTNSSSMEYWIQVGSFSQQATAEKLRNEYMTRGMTAILSQKDVGGKTYYQVKVGPYASSEEAKKWMLTVKSVKGASQDAFVTSR
ncbi:MAG TPA: SPOR domain-containing protein [Rectinema sp.]|jgi:DedD protein|nr:SPOR domain-containing protein [Rectinema sp.]HOR91215.1 SPOR domain-containing protein [Rectinema sp.]HPK79030.1 SPOR domain-containing protein [Rectinema sp.]HQG14690.1 SPOR domain-containing protein [Rectinema sp.]